MFIYEQILEAFLTAISHLYLLKNKLKGKASHIAKLELLDFQGQ